MKSLKLLILVAGLFATPAMAQEEARLELTEDPAIEVMILGVYHFANPGLDVVNMEVDDVLAPRRQREIQDLVDALAEWRPTKIALEDMAQAPALVLTDYERTEELLATDRSETVQVGYRLARQLGHEKVYGYDERATDGEPDYFPMGKVQAFAQENGGTELLGALFAEVQAVTAEEQANLPNQTIAQSLRTHNDAVRINAFHDKVYYSLLKIGNGDDQPGAELNAFWYMRNAKMFAKVDMIAEPGDRVLLIAGSGHATWLRHFVERMPGYKLIEALPY
ncbi:MAG: DUF5694 domain-containing protein, partial [Pseudomonadota bacterium]